MSVAEIVQLSTQSHHLGRQNTLQIRSLQPSPTQVGIEIGHDLLLFRDIHILTQSHIYTTNTTNPNTEMIMM